MLANLGNSHICRHGEFFKRYDEAVAIFQQDMHRAWLHEQRIKELIERYHLVVPN
jgi:hypothetical protein